MCKAVLDVSVQVDCLRKGYVIVTVSGHESTNT